MNYIYIYIFTEGLYETFILNLWLMHFLLITFLCVRKVIALIIVNGNVRNKNKTGKF